MCPSMDPRNATPGINVTGAGCAALQPGVDTHAGFGADADHSIFPSARRRAASPPPASGLPGSQSEIPKYALLSSLAPPQITPPCGPPRETLVCHSTFPELSGLSP